MNLRKYPMDTQKCVLNIMSYSYSETDAKYTWKRGHVRSVETSTDISLPQMDLVGIEASETTDTYSVGSYHDHLDRSSAEFSATSDIHKVQ